MKINIILKGKIYLDFKADKWDAQTNFQRMSLEYAQQKRKAKFSASKKIFDEYYTVWNISDTIKQEMLEYSLEHQDEYYIVIGSSSSDYQYYIESKNTLYYPVSVYTEAFDSENFWNSVIEFFKITEEEQNEIIF